MLVEIESNTTTDNMTAENLGISPEYALQDYNITADELQSVIKNINISADPFLAEIVATITFAGNLIDEQMAIVALIQIHLLSKATCQLILIEVNKCSEKPHKYLQKIEHDLFRYYPYILYCWYLVWFCYY
jgi:hypothetical protein